MFEKSGLLNELCQCVNPTVLASDHGEVIEAQWVDANKVTQSPFRVAGIVTTRITGCDAVGR